MSASKNLQKIITVLLMTFLVVNITTLPIHVSAQSNEATNLYRDLKNKNGLERANAKVDQISKSIGNVINTNTYRIKVEDIVKIDGGIEIFARVFQGNKQLGFGPNGEIDIERFRFINPPVLVQDLHGEIEKEVITETGSDTAPKTVRYRLDPHAAIAESLEYTISQVAKDGKNIIKGKVGRTTTTIYPEPNGASVAGDAHINGQNSGWASTQQGNSGTVRNDVTENVAGVRWDGYWSILRSLYNFDTSTIGSDEISSVTLALYPTTVINDVDTGNDFVVVTECNPDSNATMTIYDFNNVGNVASPVPFASTFDLSSVSTGTLQNITINATGTATVDGNGVTCFGVRIGDDVTDEPSSAFKAGGNKWNYMGYAAADETGTTNDPRLIIVHSAPAVTVKVYANTDDGYTTNSYCNESDTWSNERGYSGSFNFAVCDDQDEIKVRSDANDGAYQIYRASLKFDTSIVPDNATITAATLNLYGAATSSTDVVVTSHTRSSTTLSTVDWHITDYGSTTFASSTGGLVVNSYNSLGLNQSGQNHVNDTGDTVFGILTSYDFSNSDPGSTKRLAVIASADNSGTSTDPYLEITYITD